MQEFKYSIEQQLRIQLLEIMNKPRALSHADIILAKQLQKQLNHITRIKNQRTYLALPEVVV
jgi:hypothetical protein